MPLTVDMASRMLTGTLTALVRGPVGTVFQKKYAVNAVFAHVPLTLAHLLLFHRRLDGHMDMHTTRAHVPVKIRCQTEQTLSVGRDRRAGSIVNAIT